MRQGWWPVTSRRSTVCGICRGSKFVDAIDSNGHPYRGCARCSVAEPVKPSRWRKVGPHEYTLRMGPVTAFVTRSAWDAFTKPIDKWHFRAAIVAERDAVVIRSRASAPLAQCQADAIAAVERWRDGIR